MIGKNFFYWQLDGIRALYKMMLSCFKKMKATEKVHVPNLKIAVLCLMLNVSCKARQR